VRTAVAAAIFLVSCGGMPPSAPPPKLLEPGVFLEDITWIEAEKLLRPDTVVVIPIGAAAKEHGPHLRLSNDYVMAEYLKRRVAKRARVVIAPTVAYHYYPAFTEYPGSTTLRLETARDVIVDIVKSLARYGPRRFYALNTGVSTRHALEPAVQELAKEGILFRYTKLLEILGPIEKDVTTQQRGTHADEIETSMMIYMAPETVDMSKAVRDEGEQRDGGLTRNPSGAGVYSPSGVWGDATLATRQKGGKVTEALVGALLRDIEETRAAPLPAAHPVQ
jgi:creatinine amidohydrolase